jgi:hypothetical protein
MRRAFASQSEATLEGTMGEIVTLIIRVRAALLGIANPESVRVAPLSYVQDESRRLFITSECTSFKEVEG